MKHKTLRHSDPNHSQSRGESPLFPTFSPSWLELFCCLPDSDSQLQSLTVLPLSAVLPAGIAPPCRSSFYPRMGGLHPACFSKPLWPPPMHSNAMEASTTRWEGALAKMGYATTQSHPIRPVCHRFPYFRVFSFFTFNLFYWISNDCRHKVNM